MKRSEVEELAAIVHGFLAFGHALAVVFHLKRKRITHAALHATILIYDLPGHHGLWQVAADANGSVPKVLHRGSPRMHGVLREKLEGEMQCVGITLTCQSFCS